MPATQVEFHHLDESLEWIFYSGKREHIFRMCHKAMVRVSS